MANCIPAPRQGHHILDEKLRCPCFMNRLNLGIVGVLLSDLFLFCVVSSAVSQDEVVTPWAGRCTSKFPLPDVVCIMRRDVKSGAGGLTASFLYVQEEVSRYLRIELRHTQLDSEAKFVLRAGRPIRIAFEWTRYFA